MLLVVFAATCKERKPFISLSLSLPNEPVPTSPAVRYGPCSTVLTSTAALSLCYCNIVIVIVDAVRVAMYIGAVVVLQNLDDVGWFGVMMMTTTKAW